MDTKDASKTKRRKDDRPTHPMPVISPEDLKPKTEKKKLVYDNRDTEPLFFTEVLPEIPRRTKKRVTWKESGSVSSKKAEPPENLIPFRKKKQKKK